MTSTFTNSTIATLDLDGVVKHVATSQKNIATATETYRRKSRKDHAILMLEARTVIKQIEANVHVEAQGALLTRHQIKAATGTTSHYTPWIKLFFGKHDPEGKKVKFGGEEHVKWKSDDSFGRYFNFYEVIDRDYKGPEDKLLAWVLERGGPAAIVAAELERKREDQKPSDETTQARRDFYMAETDTPFIDLPMTVLPQDAGEFVAVIIQRTGEGCRLLGVSKKDASADLDRLAATSFEALTKAKAEREASADKERQLAEAKERGRQEAAEQMAASMGMTVEEMRANLQAMAKSAKAKVAKAKTQDAAARDAA